MSGRRSPYRCTIRGWVTTGSELPEWDGSRVSGAVSVVAGAPSAELLLLLARITGSADEVLADG